MSGCRRQPAPASRLRGAISVERNTEQAILDGDARADDARSWSATSSAPEQMVSCVFSAPPTSTRSSRRSPRATSGSTACRCSARRRSRCPGSLQRVIRVLLHYYAGERAQRRSTCTCGEARDAARRPRVGTIGPMASRHLRREARAHPALRGRRRQRRRRRAERRRRDAGLQRVPVPARAAVVEAVQRAAGRRQPLPRPGRAARCGAALADRYELSGRRHRGRQRLLRDPAGGGRGAARAVERDRLRVALVLDVPAPGRRHGREGGAGPAHRRLRPRPRRDGGRDHRPHAAAARLQPEQPDRHLPRQRRDRRVPRAGPAARARDPRRGLHRVPDRRGPGHLARPAAATSATSVLLRTFSKVYGLAGLRVGYALGSRGVRAAVDRVRQPFSVNQLAQAAATEALRHQDDVARRAEWNAAERLWMEEELARAGLDVADSQANFCWVASASTHEARSDARRSPRAGVAVRAGRRARRRRATCASPTAPAPRTSASSRPCGTHSPADSGRLAAADGLDGHRLELSPQRALQSAQPHGRGDLAIHRFATARIAAPQSHCSPFIAGDLARRSAGRRTLRSAEATGRAPYR